MDEDENTDERIKSHRDDNLRQFKNLYESMQDDCMMLDAKWSKFIGHALLGITGLSVFVYSMVKCYQHIKNNENKRNAQLSLGTTTDDNNFTTKTRKRKYSQRQQTTQSASVR